MKKSGKRRAPIALIFGEDENDSIALSHLARAIRPNMPPTKPVRNPPILIRSDALPRTRRENSERIKKVVEAAKIRNDVKLVIAHRDCDGCEPEHIELRSLLCNEIKSVGVEPIVAAVPAWSIEAWWYLWPDAVAKTRPCWRRLRPNGKNVGMIKDPKKQLIRDLRDPKAQSCRDYVESDSRRIAELVLELGIVDMLAARSASFDIFAKDLREVELD